MGKFGRQVFGTAVLASGIVNLVFHHGPMYLYVPIAAQIIGGVAIQLRPSARAGAAVVGSGYLVLALLCIPLIVGHPHVYFAWGNFFYPFANVVGAAVAYALLSPGAVSQSSFRAACVLFGVCNASFAIEQAEFLGRTASLVPMWMPPSQMFWAIVTTGPFALAAVALVIDRVALIATRLLAIMYWAFGVLVWIPLIVTDPRSPSNWSEGTETVAIGASAWILAELLARSHPSTNVRIESHV